MNAGSAVGEIHAVQHLDWQDVESSLVHSVAYDSAAERIYVQMLSGMVWRFEDCSESDYRALVAPGQSPGFVVTEFLQVRRQHARVV